MPVQQTAAGPGRAADPARAARAAGPDRGRRRQSQVRTRRAFLAPLTLILAALTIAPFVYNIAISLTDKASTNRHTGFVWFANYEALFTDTRFWTAVRVTMIFTVIAVALEMAIALAVALGLNRLSRGSSVLRALFLLPMAAAPVAVLFNWRVMLNVSYGVVDYVLGALHLPQVNWVGTPVNALATLIMIDVWQWTPFVLIIVAGGLAAVDRDVYEASAVDGAGAIQTLRYITLPLLRPYLLVALLFRSIDALKTFDSIQILTSGGPGSSTTTLNYYIFQQGISFLSFGRAAAAATILLIIAIALARLLLGGLRSKDQVST